MGYFSSIKKRSEILIVLAAIVISVLLTIGGILLTDNDNPSSITDKSVAEEYADINVSSVVNNVVDNGDGTITVDYTYTISNQNSVDINNLDVQNNLSETFNGHTFEILSTSSTGINLNPSFNGASNTTLSSGGSLPPAGTATVNIKVRVNNNNDLGPFDNNVLATATIIPTQDGSNNGSDGDTDEVDEDAVDNPDEYQEETDFTPRDVSLVLSGQYNGQYITDISNGMVIPRDLLDSNPNLKLGIILDIPTDGSIKIIASKDGVVRLIDLQNFEDYSEGWIEWLLGDGGDFSFTIQVYSKKNNGGTLISEEIINFTIPEHVAQVNQISGSGNSTFTLIPPEPTSFPASGSSNGSSGNGGSTGYTTSSSSSASNSYPKTGFGLGNTHIFGIIAIFATIGLAQTSSFLDRFRD